MPSGVPSSALPPPTLATGPGQVLQQMQEHFVDVVKIVRPWVVDIATKNALGSGIICNAHGDIVTNNTPSGRQRRSPSPSSRRGRQRDARRNRPSRDLAVIKVDVPSSALAPGTFADSGRRPVALAMPSLTLLSRPIPSNTVKGVADRLISATDR